MDIRWKFDRMACPDIKILSSGRCAAALIPVPAMNAGTTLYCPEILDEIDGCARIMGPAGV